MIEQKIIDARSKLFAEKSQIMLAAMGNKVFKVYFRESGIASENIFENLDSSKLIEKIKTLSPEWLHVDFFENDEIKIEHGHQHPEEHKYICPGVFRVGYGRRCNEFQTQEFRNIENARRWNNLSYKATGLLNFIFLLCKKFLAGLR